MVKRRSREHAEAVPDSMSKGDNDINQKYVFSSHADPILSDSRERPENDAQSSSKGRCKNGKDLDLAKDAKCEPKSQTAQPARSNRYEEITEEQLVSNCQAKAGKEQDPSASSLVPSRHTSPKESPKARVRCLQYEEITDEQLLSNQNAKRTEEKETQKTKLKEGKKKNKREKTLQVQEAGQISSDAASNHSAPKNSPKTAARHHPYDEITDDQIISKQKAKKKDSEEKQKTKENPKKQNKADKKKNKEMKELNPAGINEAVDVTANVTTEREKHKINTRYHPYEEVTQEQIASSQNSHNMKEKEKIENHEQSTAADPEPAEYLNVAAIAASVSSCGDEDKKSSEKDDDLAELYSVPVKKQLKVRECQRERERVSWI